MAKTILLVEDNDDNRLVYGTILQHYGYEVVGVDNGIDAVRVAGSIVPDLVLMDVSLPGLDGWEATSRIKSDPAMAHIPVVALTAHALISDREKAEAVGFDAYLAKPCEPRTVVQVVTELIGTAASRAR